LCFIVSLRLFPLWLSLLTHISLQGEGEDVAKSESPNQDDFDKGLTPPNMVFSSTAVSTGKGLGVVVATGMQTRVGSIARLLQNDPTQPPHDKGQHLLKALLFLSLLLCLLFLRLL
jgi:Ca2+-transporting ATPase